MKILIEWWYGKRPLYIKVLRGMILHTIDSQTTTVLIDN